MTAPHPHGNATGATGGVCDREIHEDGGGDEGEYFDDSFGQSERDRADSAAALYGWPVIEKRRDAGHTKTQEQRGRQREQDRDRQDQQIFQVAIAQARYIDGEAGKDPIEKTTRMALISATRLHLRSKLYYLPFQFSSSAAPFR
ncbi:MAG TPA: hypothetical protein VGJ39_15540 [Vicinamibacterales bacterium]|jgi:hypothetical protein